MIRLIPAIYYRALWHIVYCIYTRQSDAFLFAVFVCTHRGCWNVEIRRQASSSKEISPVSLQSFHLCNFKHWFDQIYAEALRKKANGNGQYSYTHVTAHAPRSSVKHVHKSALNVLVNARNIKTQIHAPFFHFQLSDGLENGPHSELPVMFYVKWTKFAGGFTEPLCT
jgi:hypothetical protein